MRDFREALNRKLLIFDGGMGTLLQENGLQGGELPEVWNIERPDVVRGIHADYAAAGADILTTNTFGANGAKLHGTAHTAPALVKAGVALAREAAGEGVFVALDLGPTGRLLAPFGDLPFEEAYTVFKEAIEAGSGADLILIETMSDTVEMKAALLAAKENSALPVVVTCTFDENGKLLTGGTVEAVALLLESLGADAVGINCGLGPVQMLPLLTRMTAATHLPVCINPNAGLPVTVNGKTQFTVGAEEFADCAEQFFAGGAALLGGCCGTTPAHIGEISRRLKGKHVTVRERAQKTRISSGARVVEFGQRPILIGERINPTGKPRLREALKSGDFEYLCREAIAQAERGADVLDVNVGVPGIDEAAAMEKAVLMLQGVTELPLQIDTGDTEALSRALRLYNGKPLVNSVNGKAESLHSVLPLVKQYGAAVVALTLDENGIPETAAERAAIAEKIIETAAGYGIDRSDILVDTLTMTVSTGADNAKITLDALQTVRETLHVHTVLGVSNVSFGLPRREVITAAFFTMAMQRGLSAGIVNPLSDDLMHAFYAFCALSGADEACKAYITALSDTAPAAPAASSEMTLHTAIVRGLKEEAGRRTAELLQSTPALEIIETSLIPALDEVGKGFERGTLFLPQLLMSADAAKEAFALIRADFAKQGIEQATKGKVLLATVKGDVHDIGKNIVKVLLQNYGFDVVDLGRDVPPEMIVKTAAAENIRLVGLSALMTTTLPGMAETIRQLRHCHDCKVMVGGAVLTAEYAAEIGADFYSKDAMGSVRYAESVLG